jgi:hypothetical protein
VLSAMRRGFGGHVEPNAETGVKPNQWEPAKP